MIQESMASQKIPNTEKNIEDFVAVSSVPSSNTTDSGSVSSAKASTTKATFKRLQKDSVFATNNPVAKIKRPWKSKNIPVDMPGTDLATSIVPVSVSEHLSIIPGNEQKRGRGRPRKGEKSKCTHTVAEPGSASYELEIDDSRKDIVNLRSRSGSTCSSHSNNTIPGSASNELEMDDSRKGIVNPRSRSVSTGSTNSNTVPKSASNEIKVDDSRPKREDIVNATAVLQPVSVIPGNEKRRGRGRPRKGERPIKDFKSTHTVSGPDSVSNELEMDGSRKDTVYLRSRSVSIGSSNSNSLTEENCQESGSLRRRSRSGSIGRGQKDSGNGEVVLGSLEETGTKHTRMSRPRSRDEAVKNSSDNAVESVMLTSQGQTHLLSMSAPDNDSSIGITRRRSVSVDRSDAGSESSHSSDVDVDVDVDEDVEVLDINTTEPVIIMVGCARCEPWDKTRPRKRETTISHDSCFSLRSASPKSHMTVSQVTKSKDLQALDNQEAEQSVTKTKELQSSDNQEADQSMIKTKKLKASDNQEADLSVPKTKDLLAPNNQEAALSVTKTKNLLALNNQEADLSVPKTKELQASDISNQRADLNTKDSAIKKKASAQRKRQPSGAKKRRVQMQSAGHNNSVCDQSEGSKKGSSKETRKYMESVDDDCIIIEQTSEKDSTVDDEATPQESMTDVPPVSVSQLGIESLPEEGVEEVSPFEQLERLFSSTNEYSSPCKNLPAVQQVDMQSEHGQVIGEIYALQSDTDQTSPSQEYILPALVSKQETDSRRKRSKKEKVVDIERRSVDSIHSLDKQREKVGKGSMKKGSEKKARKSDETVDRLGERSPISENIDMSQSRRGCRCSRDKRMPSQGEQSEADDTLPASDVIALPANKPKKRKSQSREREGEQGVSEAEHTADGTASKSQQRKKQSPVRKKALLDNEQSEVEEAADQTGSKQKQQHKTKSSQDDRETATKTQKRGQKRKESREGFDPTTEKTPSQARSTSTTKECKYQRLACMYGYVPGFYPNE